MRLAKTVEDRCFRTGSHPHCPQLMKDCPPDGDPERELPYGLSLCQVGPSCFFHNTPECFLHVLCHADLVGPPLKVKAQDGDSPFICDMGIYFAVSLFLGDHLTTN